MSSATRWRGWIAGSAASLLLFSVATTRASEPLPDPTLPPEEARTVAAEAPEQKANAELELRAIFHATDRQIAVINGRRVGVSDQVGGARVLAIEADRVRLERAGEILELELVSPAFKNARREGEQADLPVPASPDEAHESDPQGALR